MSALLPENREEATLGTMVVGKVMYTVPWAMWINRGRECLLDLNYTAYTERGGTVQLKVSRTEAGYVVDATHCRDEKWRPQSDSGHMGGSVDEPVLEVIW